MPLTNRIQYPPAARDFCLRVKFRDGGYLVKQLRSRFALDTKSVLDFGCGTGRIASVLGSRSYVGIDVDVVRVGFAAAQCPRNSFLVYDGDTIPFRNESFDVVFVSSVLHHLSDAAVRYYSEEFSRVLIPDGQVIVLEPAYNHSSPLRNLYMRTFDQGSYIRETSAYMRLLHDQFQMTHELSYNAANFYTNTLLSGVKRSPAQ